jgi:hypothetical protein
MGLLLVHMEPFCSHGTFLFILNLSVHMEPFCSHRATPANPAPSAWIHYISVISQDYPNAHEFTNHIRQRRWNPACGRRVRRERFCAGGKEGILKLLASWYMIRKPTESKHCPSNLIYSNTLNDKN